MVPAGRTMQDTGLQIPFPYSPQALETMSIEKNDGTTTGVTERQFLITILKIDTTYANFDLKIKIS